MQAQAVSGDTGQANALFPALESLRERHGSGSWYMFFHVAPGQLGLCTLEVLAEVIFNCCAELVKSNLVFGRWVLHGPSLKKWIIAKVLTQLSQLPGKDKTIASINRASTGDCDRFQNVELARTSLNRQLLTKKKPAFP